MEKNRQELIDNYKAEQRAIKVRKTLTKTRDWGENLAALLVVLSVVGAVVIVCVGLWGVGLGFIPIAAGVVLAVVIIWMLIDHWSYNELEKARYRRYKEMREED